jgi:hypothetical protein
MKEHFLAVQPLDRFMYAEPSRARQVEDCGRAISCRFLLY